MDGWIVITLVGALIVAAFGGVGAQPQQPTVIYVQQPLEDAPRYGGGCMMLVVAAIALLLLTRLTTL